MSDKKQFRFKEDAIYDRIKAAIGEEKALEILESLKKDKVSSYTTLTDTSFNSMGGKLEKEELELLNDLGKCENLAEFVQKNYDPHLYDPELTEEKNKAKARGMFAKNVGQTYKKVTLLVARGLINKQITIK